MRCLILPLLAIGVLRCTAQTLDSHEVHADRSITFRYVNPGAKSVVVDTDAEPSKLTMVRDARGVWMATTRAHLPPEHYGYQLVVDGVAQLDPLNHDVRYNLDGLYDDVLVKGDPPAPWELTAIAHGHVDRRMFTTHVAQHLPGGQERYIVYTPPGYDARRKGGYPVLYLLHGWSQIEDDWDSIGQANLMLDAMIDGGKAVPMIVVMPLLYGDYEFALGGHAVWNDAAKIDRNEELSTKLLMNEVVPAVEAEYNVAKGRETRAIAGLSMGGLQSLQIGLTHAEAFAWVGGFSAALQDEGFDQQIPGVKAKKADLKLLWVSCGTEDRLLKANRDFVSWAKGNGLPVRVAEMPGKHTWLVWRESLLEFVPLLFRK